MTSTTELHLVPYLTASGILEKRYESEKASGNRIIDAHLATVGAYDWRRRFHAILADEIPGHDCSFVCDVCFAAAEFSMLHIFSLLNAIMVEAITYAFEPENYGKNRGSEKWRDLVGELAHQLARAIEPELHERLGLGEPEESPCSMCTAAGRTSVQCWLSGSYDNLLTRNVSFVHSVFRWSCPFPHGGD